MKTILIGSDNERFADSHMTYSDISESDLTQVTERIKDYIEFTFSLEKDFSFYDNFDIDRSIMGKVKELCYRDIRSYLDTGISNKKTKSVETEQMKISKRPYFSILSWVSSTP